MKIRRFRIVLLAAVTAVIATAAAATAGMDGPWPKPVHDSMLTTYVSADLLEYEGAGDRDNLRWDMHGWFGGDYNRLWVKTEGRHEGRDATGDADAELLYGRLVAPFWDLQVGVRQEWKYEKTGTRTRSFAVIGFQGLAPYWFELEPTLYISHKGDVSARITADYDLLLTQRLVLQPRLEMNLAAQKVPEFGIGRGVSDIDLGIRLRYEITRKFAPYIGFSWRRDTGETAAMARHSGKETEASSVVAGIRMWY